jgi:hypothetical protein
MSRVSRATQQTVEVSIQQQKFLLRMVKTLSRKLKKADDKIRRLNDKNAARTEELTLTRIEQARVRVGRKQAVSVRVRALERNTAQPQEELDQALAAIRKHDPRTTNRISSRKKKRPIPLRAGSR